MDALKIVPQLFFDLIARVIPGSSAILLYFVLFDPTWSFWRKLMDGMLPYHATSGDSSAGFVVLALLLVAYVLGHLISPLVKAAQRIGENFPPALAKSNSQKYDWLRLHAPDAGALCAKLRAEFTMYNGLAVVFALFGAASLLVSPANWVAVVGLFVLALLMGYRGRETKGTFTDCIENFHTAAHKPA